MATLRSPHWNEQTGTCEKHLIMMVPCPKCAVEKDPDVEAVYSLTDQDIAICEQIPLTDFLPENFSWVTNAVYL